MARLFVDCLLRTSVVVLFLFLSYKDCTLLTRVRVSSRNAFVPGGKLPISRRCAGQAQSQDAEHGGTFSKATQITTMFYESSSASLLIGALQPALASSLFDGIAVGAFFVRLAKLQCSISLRERHDVLLNTLVNRTKQMLLHDGIGPRQMANVFWSVAKLQSTLPELQTLIPALLCMSKAQANKMDPQGISNVIWGCATLRLPPDQMNDIVDPLAEAAFLNADAFTPQALSNIVWSCGKLREDAPGFMDLVPLLLNADVVRSLKQFDTQALANLCWGLALCNCKEPSFMARVASEMARRSPSLNDRSADLDLPQIACSFAKLGTLDTTMMKAIATRMAPRIQRVNEWGLCALIWSYDKLDIERRFLNFRAQLHAEALRKSIVASDIEQSPKGPDVWRT